MFIGSNELSITEVACTRYVTQTTEITEFGHMLQGECAEYGRVLSSNGVLAYLVFIVGGLTAWSFLDLRQKTF